MKKTYQKPAIKEIFVLESMTILAASTPGTSDGFGKENNFEDEDGDGYGNGNSFTPAWNFPDSFADFDEANNN